MKIPENLTRILSEQFSEGDLKDIEKAFEEAVNIQVESRVQQDNAEKIAKIEELVEAINECHKVQMTKLQDKWKAKFSAISETTKAKHNAEIVKEADEFKTIIANNIERYIDSKIDKIVDFNTICEAAKNKTASIVLKSLRKQLAVDSALMRESIANPIKEAQDQLQNYRALISKLRSENKQLNESLETSKSDLLIENKVANLPEAAAKHMRTMLKGKTVDYINENYDYIKSVYETGINQRREQLASEAMKNHSKAKNRVNEPRRNRDLIKNSSVAIDEDPLVSECFEALGDPFAL